MVSESAAAHIITLLEEADIDDIMIGGGWGIDAIVGFNTRKHNDIDIVVEQKYHQAACEALAAGGFELLPNNGRPNFVQMWANQEGELVDLYTFVFNAKGEYVMGEEIYPVDMFDCGGFIGGKVVRCTQPQYQLRYHCGYVRRAEDAFDVHTLCSHLDLPYPDDYQP